MSLETHHPNDQSQQEEILIAPELPPRLTTNRHMLQKMSKPYVSNQNQFAVLLKNKRQITSLTAGLIVLLGSGVHTVWAFWEIYSATSWLEKEVIIMVGSWYLASLIGSAAAAVLIPKWSKKNIYILAAFILLLSSLLFCSRLFTEFRINSILFSGRFLGGLANGLAYLTVITQAAENAVNQIRGLILRGVGYVLAFSLLIAGFTTNGTIENDIDSELIMGYLNLFYSVLAIILAPFLTIESAPYLLQQTDENTVAEREAIVIATMVCAKNVPFTVLIMGFFNHLFNPETFSLYMLFLLLSCRFIFGMLTMFFIDKFERKKYLYICAILCGILLLITCFVVSNSKEDFFQFSSVFSFGIIVFFVFASMSIDVLGHVQTSEAFSYATKSVSIVIATGVEHIVHTIFIIVFKLQYDVYAFVLISMGLIIMGLSTLLTVPAKTKGLSLRQTRDIYRNVKFVITSESID